MQDAHSVGYAMGFMMGALIAVGILLIPFIFYLLTLQKAFKRCSPENRVMEPGMVWLMFIPLFNLVWHFFIVLKLAESLGREFQKRGIAEEPQPGKGIGLTMCILHCCGVIPLIGILCGLAGFVCWIIYWVKIAGFSKKLETAPLAAPVG